MRTLSVPSCRRAATRIVAQPFTLALMAMLVGGPWASGQGTPNPPASVPTAATSSPKPDAESDSDPNEEPAGLLLRDFRPKSQLRVAENLKTHAKFAVVDVHTHFHYKLRSSVQALDDFVKVMDRNRIAVCVSLDGKLGGQLEEHRQYLWTKYRDRFVIYANVDWQGDGSDDDPATWPATDQALPNERPSSLPKR